MNKEKLLRVTWKKNIYDFSTGKYAMTQFYGHLVQFVVLGNGSLQGIVITDEDDTFACVDSDELLYVEP